MSKLLIGKNFHGNENTLTSLDLNLDFLSLSKKKAVVNICQRHCFEYHIETKIKRGGETDCMLSGDLFSFSVGSP